MPKRGFFDIVPDGAKSPFQWVAIARSWLTQLEARVAARGLIVSDVYGADLFVDRAPPTAPHPLTPVSDPARWDEALDFEPHTATEPHDFPRFLWVDAVPPVARAQHDDKQPAVREQDWDKRECVPPPPLVLYRATTAPGATALARPTAFRMRWQMFAIAACLIVAWIGSGQSDPLGDDDEAVVPELGFQRAAQLPSTPTRNLAADALADTFAQPPSQALQEAIYGDHEARLRFAPRIALFYGDAMAMTGSIDSHAEDEPASPAAPQVAEAGDDDRDDALLPLLSNEAALVMIRNLPEGTMLSSGTRVSSTDWALSSGDLKSVVVTLPENRSGPVRAQIEVFGMSGTSAGTVAVEIREATREREQASAPRRAKVYATARSKPASPRRKVKAVAQPQPAPKPDAAKTAAVLAPPPNPASQSLLPQLPFLPGPYDPAAPAGTTVDQQIMINLGVSPSAPITGFTQPN